MDKESVYEKVVDGQEWNEVGEKKPKLKKRKGVKWIADGVYKYEKMKDVEDKEEKTFEKIKLAQSKRKTVVKNEREAVPKPISPKKPVRKLTPEAHKSESPKSGKV